MTRKYESTAVMLRPDQLERLRALSAETHMPMSVMHRKAIDEWLGERMVDLIDAAWQAPCTCSLEWAKRHDGVCISCWALEATCVRLEARIADPLPHARRPELTELMKEMLEQRRAEQHKRAQRSEELDVKKQQEQA